MEGEQWIEKREQREKKMCADEREVCASGRDERGARCEDR
jgi:hypothetical protein